MPQRKMLYISNKDKRHAGFTSGILSCFYQPVTSTVWASTVKLNVTLGSLRPFTNASAMSVAPGNSVGVTEANSIPMSASVLLAFNAFVEPSTLCQEDKTKVSSQYKYFIEMCDVDMPLQMSFYWERLFLTSNLLNCISWTCHHTEFCIFYCTKKSKKIKKCLRSIIKIEVGF